MASSPKPTMDFSIHEGQWTMGNVNLVGLWARASMGQLWARHGPLQTWDLESLRAHGVPISPDAPRATRGFFAPLFLTVLLLLSGLLISLFLASWLPSTEALKPTH